MGLRRAYGVRRPALAGAVAVLALLAGCSGGSTSERANSGGSGAEAPVAAGSSTSASPGDGVVGFGQIPGIVRDVQPDVVTIIVPNTDLGSGVVYDGKGDIVTNNHVVCPQQSGTSCAQTVKVQFADGRQVDGKVLARDPLTDLAVVRTGRTGLSPAAFAKSLPEIGSLAVAIGSPLGFQESVTAGIISGTHRDIPSSLTGGNPALVDLIQTDAAISPGNSGGALVNAAGRVVGINDAYIPPQQGAVAIGFAIPAPTVTKIADELIADGKATHPFLGVVLRDLTPQIAQALGIQRDAGAVVEQVYRGTPAAKAALRPGDLIVKTAGEAVGSVQDVTVALRGHEPGEQIPLAYVRGGATQTVTVTLAERPSRLQS